MNFPTFLTAALLLSMATPVLAAQGDVYTNTGGGSKLIQDGSPNSSPSLSTARSHATGGNATGGNATAAGGNGGHGGRGGNSNVSVYGGGGNTNGGLAITTPEGFGVAPCGGGLGLSGLGLGGGGSGGGTLWEFGECKIMREANALQLMGYHDAAVAELCQIDRVRQAFGGKCPGEGKPEAVVSTTKWGEDYCITRNAGDRNQHRECDRSGVILPAR